MWHELKEENKQKYKTFITNFASLSEIFSQKNSDEQHNQIVTPVINSKFQETVFQKSFGAIGEDIANTSYDASLIIDENQKYLVGIKSFGLNSGDQKIAQFKSSSTSENWEETLSLIKRNADSSETKEIADNKNKSLYLQLAIRIATLRNARIASSKEQIKGFKATDKTVDAVYHVLMTSKNEGKPKIYVGEIDYLPINIKNIEIIGSTSKSNPTNFKFKDGFNQYKYTSADSQLYMTFNNTEIVLEDWDVEYVDDPFYLFEQLHLKKEEPLPTHEEDTFISSVSWMIANKKGEVEESSGYNGFDGASKLARIGNYREKRIKLVKIKHQNKISEQQIKNIIDKLNKILLTDWKSSKEKNEMKRIRLELINYVESIGNKELLQDIEALVYRPSSEMYIPIPDSRKFHESNPDFFGKDVGLFKGKSSKLLLPKEKRRFRLEFLASGDSIVAYINQDSGKGIQSYGNQQILGEWILRGVFQLEPREILTGKRLEEVGINAIRLNKFKDPSRGVGLEFIWIDEENPPADAIGWIDRNK